MFQALVRILQRQFYRYNGWLFSLGLLVAAYVLCQMTGQPSAATFFPLLGSLLLVFGPLLIYVFWREASRVAPPKRVDILIFGIYGLVVSLLGPDVQQLPFTPYFFEADSWANQQSIRIVALSFLLIEFWLRWQQGWTSSKAKIPWLLRFRSPWLPTLFLGFAVVLLLLSSNILASEVASRAGEAKAFYAVSAFLQSFVVYLAYYGLFLVHHRQLFCALYPQRGLVIYLAATLALLLIFTPVHAWLASQMGIVVRCMLHPVAVEPSSFASAHFLFNAGFLCLTLPYSIVTEWYRKQAAIEQLESERNRTELALLKEQIKPHFFFNTLNNLYAMSLGKDERTPETILQLSELMRYVIYRGKAASVPLEEEIKYLQDYLDLQSIRLRKKLDLKFEISITDKNINVPPLLFIILLENAFKHGVEPAGEAALLHIECLATSSVITFTCLNSIDPDYEADESGGLGLTNLRRRLELLFPGQYQLTTEQHSDKFLAKLLLPNIPSK